MAFLHGKSTKIFLNGFDLTGFLTKLNVPGMAEVADTTTFGKNSKTKITGVRDAKLAGEGYFSHDNVTLADVDDAFAAALASSSDSNWLYLPEGDAFGKRSISVTGVETTHETESSIDGVVGVKAECEATERVGSGVVYFPLASRSAASTDSTSVDNTVTSANGASISWQITVTNATGTPQVKLQHSSDNSTFVDLIDSGALTATVQGGRAVLAAGTTINRYLRARFMNNSGHIGTAVVAASRF